jgi:hypothetical protein
MSAFDALDRNHDGVITPAEFNAVQGSTSMPTTTFAAPAVTYAAPALQTYAAPVTTYAAPAMMTEPVAFAAPATTSGSASMFDQIDSNHDGVITKAEFQQFGK